MQNSKGITLVSLVISIIVLLILASIATYSGFNVVNSSKLTAFTAELKVMQTQVNTIYQENKQEPIGQEITGDIQTQANIVFTESESGITSQDGYRYWNQEQIKELGIEGVEQEFFVNLEKRSVVSYQGLRLEGKTYYTLAQVPNGLYNVGYENPNEGKPTFQIDGECIGAEKWRITISNIQYNGYIEKWQVKYQLEGQESWNTSEDLSFVVNKDGTYKIQIVNGNVISEEQTKYLGYAKDGLQLYYDGMNNTRNGNNPNATAWEDLSGNENDGIFYNMNTEKGYYSADEKGYVFLENASYIESKNKIVISGDALYTMEAVMKPFDETVPYQGRTPLWWGSETADDSKSATMSYNYITSKFVLGFVNSAIISNDTYHILGQTVNMAFRKTSSGEIKSGDTEVGIISYNGKEIPSTYTGKTFTPNLLDTKVQIGRSWQWNNENRTLYGSIQAIRIYNRALTDEEIEMNYQIDKARFHIK